MKILLVVNPVASAVRPGNRAAVERALGAKHDLTVVVTTADDHGVVAAAKAAAAEVEVVVALGGDGTANEVANALVGSATALGVLPGGSTNVFARTIGFPKHVLPALDQLVAALDARSVRRIGMGQAGARHFLFHVGVGFDAAVVQRVDQHGDLKRWLGHGLFAYDAIATWLNHYDRSRPRFSIQLPDGEVIPDGYFAIIEETDPYTYFGPQPFRLVPGVAMDSGPSLVVLRDLSAATLVGAGLAALTGGNYLSRLGHVAVRRGVNTVHIEGFGPFPYQVDGEYLGEVESLEISHWPACLDVVVPPPSSNGETITSH